MSHTLTTRSRPVTRYTVTDQAAYARRLGRDAAAEQARMDLIRAQHLRASARKAAR
jgi:hypothetical protein